MPGQKVIAIDWSNRGENLAVFDGKVLTHEMPTPGTGYVIVTENLPVKYARPYFDEGVTIYRCTTHLTVAARRRLGIEKSHDGDVRIIYDSFRDNPSAFVLWKFDPHFAQLNDIYVTFKQI